METQWVALQALSFAARQPVGVTGFSIVFFFWNGFWFISECYLFIDFFRYNFLN